MKMDLITYLYDQLPEQLRDELYIEVDCDAHLLRARAAFTDARKRKYETELEEIEIEGRELRAKIPEMFVLHLCAVV